MIGCARSDGHRIDAAPTEPNIARPLQNWSGRWRFVFLILATIPFGPSSRIAFTVIAEGHMRVRHLTHGIELIRDASDHIITLEGVAEVVC